MSISDPLHTVLYKADFKNIGLKRSAHGKELNIQIIMGGAGLWIKIVMSPAARRGIGILHIVDV